MADGCGKCKYWQEVPTGRKDQRLGLCRRSAPVPLMIGQQPNRINPAMISPLVVGFFPETRPDVWCGEFQLAEMAFGKGLPQIDLSKLADMPLDAVEQ